MKKFSKYLIALTLVTFMLLGAFISCEDKVETAKADFWVAFKAAVTKEVAEVADVTYKNDDITVVFKDGVLIQDVKDAAEALFEALSDMVDSGTLTLDEPTEETFDLDDDDVVVEVARHLLGDKGAGDFLSEKVEITSPYSAKVKYDGVDFTLKGTLKFDVAAAE